MRGGALAVPCAALATGSHRGPPRRPLIVGFGCPGEPRSSRQAHVANLLDGISAPTIMPTVQIDNEVNATRQDTFLAQAHRRKKLSSGHQTTAYAPRGFDDGIRKRNWPIARS
jgi:hypothetical protein